jgi:hypothetical protein
MTRSTLDTGICNSHAPDVIPTKKCTCPMHTVSGEVVRAGNDMKCPVHGMLAIPPTSGLVMCPGCDRYTDPTVCHCGAGIADGRMHDNHAPVPMGCNCRRDVR